MSKNYTRAFTLVELLVSLSIVGVIMTTVLYGYSSFNDNLALTSAGQEMAIAVRKTQTYGLTVKEVTPGGGQFSFAYGIYFNQGSDPNNYYIFADINSNNKYDAGNGCGSGSTECIQKFPLRNNVKISQVCNESACPPSGATTESVLFLRPNPDAGIYFTNSVGVIVAGPSVTGKVILSSAQNKTLTITIESTGQVSVQ